MVLGVLNCGMRCNGDQSKDLGTGCLQLKYFDLPQSYKCVLSLVKLENQ